MACRSAPNRAAGPRCLQRQLPRAAPGGRFPPWVPCVIGFSSPYDAGTAAVTGSLPPMSSAPKAQDLPHPTPAARSARRPGFPRMPCDLSGHALTPSPPRPCRADRPASRLFDATARPVVPVVPDLPCCAMAASVDVCADTAALPSHRLESTPLEIAPPCPAAARAAYRHATGTA